MYTESEINILSDKASHYFENGFHCAEAVVSAVLEALDQNPVQAVSHATAFGGGMAKTFEEACGAFTGGLISIGHLYGRKKPGENWDIPVQLGTEFRHSFLKKYETMHCGSLRQCFGEKQPEKCSRLVAITTKKLLKLLLEYQEITRMAS